VPQRALREPQAALRGDLGEGSALLDWPEERRREAQRQRQAFDVEAPLVLEQPAHPRWCGVAGRANDQLQRQEREVEGQLLLEHRLGPELSASGRLRHDAAHDIDAREALCCARQEQVTREIRDVEQLGERHVDASSHGDPALAKRCRNRSGLIEPGIIELE
jgi:hypothetical protein